MNTLPSQAEQKLRELMQEEKEAVGLRIYVRGAAATGTNMERRSSPRFSDDDTVIEKGDVKIILDSQSAPLLKGRCQSCHE